jgi:hypothetical protein
MADEHHELKVTRENLLNRLAPRLVRFNLGGGVE